MCLQNLKNKPQTVIIANGYLGNNTIFSQNELDKIFSVNFFGSKIF